MELMRSLPNTLHHPISYTGIPKLSRHQTFWYFLIPYLSIQPVYHNNTYIHVVCLPLSLRRPEPQLFITLGPVSIIFHTMKIKWLVITRNNTLLHFVILEWQWQEKIRRGKWKFLDYLNLFRIVQFHIYCTKQFHITWYHNKKKADGLGLNRDGKRDVATATTPHHLFCLEHVKNISWHLFDFTALLFLLDLSGQK